MSQVWLSFFDVALWTSGLLTAASVLFLVLAIGRTAGFELKRAPDPPSWPSMTVLKPLCGAEPLLEAAISSFLDQTYPGPLRFVFGVHDAEDPAAALVRRLASLRPHLDVRLIQDERLPARNRKVANLMNMWTEVEGDIVVVSDSDVFVRPDALAGLARTLQVPTNGAVTALYFGRPSDPENLWDRMGAAYLDAWFTPSALMHAVAGGPSVCYGPLTAIKRSVFEKAGGFDRLRDSLADDTELGHLVRREGLNVAFADQAVETIVAERTLAAMALHERRWARTTRALQPTGYAASIVMHAGPIPWFFAIAAHSFPALVVAAALPVLRWCLISLLYWRLDHHPVAKPSPLALFAREQIYFAVWLSGFWTEDVVWRGRRLRVARHYGSTAFMAPGVRLGPRLEA